MPMIIGKDKTVTQVNGLSLTLLSWLMWSIYYIFFVTLIFGMIRLVLILIFAFLEKYHTNPRRKYTKNTLSISVIVPAYNEEKVIKKTIDSLLMSTYDDFDIIIVDDGSTDDTVAVVKKWYSDHAKVRLLEKTNSGK